MALAQQRHAEDRAIPDLLLHFLKSIFWISQDISDLDRSAFEHCSPDYATPSRFKWDAQSRFPVCGRATDSVNVLSTVCKSKVERLMTFRTSAVAVCCWRDCRNSESSRVFSMAITAWAAKFFTNSICD